MNKYFLYFILLLPGLGFLGCKKENRNTAPPAGGKKYAVRFNLNNVAPAMAAAGSRQNGSFINLDATEPVTGNFGKLSYVLFDSNGLLHQFTQDSTLSYFGTITDSLPPGNYTAAIAAGHSLLKFAPNDFYFGTQSAGIQDFMEKTFSFTVTSGQVNQNVTLTRKIGELQIKINDTIPANASSLKVSITNDYYEYDMKLDTVVGPGSVRSFSNTVPVAARGTSGYQFSTLIGNVSTPFTVTIVCYDTTNKAIVTATIYNVYCKANTITILSGNLFSSGTSFTINANAVWSTTPAQIIKF